MVVTISQNSPCRTKSYRRSWMMQIFNDPHISIRNQRPASEPHVQGFPSYCTRIRCWQRDSCRRFFLDPIAISPLRADSRNASIPVLSAGQASQWDANSSPQRPTPVVLRSQPLLLDGPPPRHEATHASLPLPRPTGEMPSAWPAKLHIPRDVPTAISFGIPPGVP